MEFGLLMTGITIYVSYKFDMFVFKIAQVTKENVGRTGAVGSVPDYRPRGPGSRPGRGTVCYGIEQVTFTHCLVLVKPRKPWTDDWNYLVPNVLSPRDLV